MITPGHMKATPSGREQLRQRAPGCAAAEALLPPRKVVGGAVWARPVACIVTRAVSSSAPIRKRERTRLCKVSRSDHKAPEHRAETAQTDKSTTPAGAAPTRAPTTLVHTDGYRNGSRKQALARPSNTPCDCLKPACDCLKPALQPPLHAYRLYGRAPAEHAQQGQRH